MSASSVWVGLGTDSRVVMAIDVPKQLNTKAIDQAVVMATCRLRFLLSEQYRRSINARVSQRKFRKAAVTA